MRLNFKIGGKSTLLTIGQGGQTIITCLSKVRTFQVYNQIQMALALFKSQVSFFKKKALQHQIDLLLLLFVAAGKAFTMSTTNLLRTGLTLL